jgi:prepilin-type N-terminal cleavage/methylation domain-containing protein/prepilin-type processing-associated H-X9-DG protein
MTVRTNAAHGGLTLLEVMIVIMVIAVLVAIYLPQMSRRTVRSSGVNCVNNLKQIGLSFRIWGQDNNDEFPMRHPIAKGGTKELIPAEVVWPHFKVMSNELSTPKVLVCPVDTRRTNAFSFERLRDFNISYFVGVDADETNPQMILAGDDNLAVAGAQLSAGLASLWTNTPVAWTAERHSHQGNIGLADGSVQQVTSRRLQSFLAGAGVATNRLVFP